MESISKSITITVGEEMTARTVKSGSLRVLATPALIARMEETACLCAAEVTQAGKTTVGTEISVRHMAATPVGMQITVTATLLRQEGKVLSFSLHAEDACGPIGEGTHTRVMVDAERFQQKADSKGAASGGNQDH